MMEKCKACGQIHGQRGHGVASGGGLAGPDPSAKKGLPVVKSVISMEGQETISTEGTAIVALNMVESKDGVDVNAIIVGSYNMETTIAMIQALDSAKDQLAEELYKNSNPVELMALFGMIGKSVKK